MNLLIILTLTVVASASVSAFPERQLVPRNRVMPVLASTKIEGRITNGETATTGQIPYQVGLTLVVDENLAFFCGGSLISTEWVLTAAHCVDGTNYAIVRLGATERTSPEISHTVPKTGYIIHEFWNSETLKNDIALIKIPKTLKTNRIGTVKLPPFALLYPSYTGKTAIASGWGLESDSSTTVADTLQYVKLVVISNLNCQETFGSTVTSGNICVNTLNGKSTCFGDSGGPLVEVGQQIQIGVTSFVAAVGCEKGFPAGFTRVTNYLIWIAKNTGIKIWPYTEK